MAAAYEKYCAKKYLKIYKDEYSHILGTKTSANALKTAERKAQKTAIESAFKMALKPANKSQDFLAGFL